MSAEGPLGLSSLTWGLCVRGRAVVRLRGMGKVSLLWATSPGPLLSGACLVEEGQGIRSVSAATPGSASRSTCTGGLAVEVSACLWFPEVIGWEPANVCHCCAIIPGLLRPWLYEKILGYDSPERLSGKQSKHCAVLLPRVLERRKLSQGPRMFWQVNVPVPLSLVLEDSQRGILGNSLVFKIFMTFMR